MRSALSRKAGSAKEMISKRRPEILSPCGGPESVEAALSCGADAVYLGAADFSARKNAVNFTPEELKAAVSLCHRRGVAVYLALNTVLKDSELSAAASLLRLCCELKIDGVIFQDMAVYEMAKAACPGLSLHASTQMSIHTPEGVSAAGELGIKRVVVARELSLSEIKSLCGLGPQIEVFVHGALCMCVSGQCFLSYAIGGRSANRGLCAGACRLPFSSQGKPHDEYALSLKDLSLCDHLDELEKAGVSSFKIEGRMKRPEYVAAATNAVYSAMNGLEYNREQLRAVFSRSGFTDGYLTQRLGKDMFGARRREDVAAAPGALPDIRRLYAKPLKRFSLTAAFRAILGEPMSLTLSDGELSATVSGSAPEAAKTRATTKAEISEQLSKLGGTQYELASSEIILGEGLYISASEINGLRRRAVEELDSARENKFAPISFDSSALSLNFPAPLNFKRPVLRLRAEKISQLSKIDIKNTETVIPLRLAEEYAGAGYRPEKCVLSLPRFDADEKKTAERLQFAKSLGFSDVECGNIGQIRLVKRLGMTPQGGFGLNVTNSLAARHYFSGGVKTLVLSPELKASGGVSCPGRLGAVIYGRLPLMITRNCPIAAQSGCKNCRRCLTDRTGAIFPVLCRRPEGIYELLNSRPIWLADRLDGISLDFGDIWLTVESAEEAADVWAAYLEGKKAPGAFTRG